MAHEFNPNFNPLATQYIALWRLTRLMKKAGYRVRASSNGNAAAAKDVTGLPQNDWWNRGEAVNAAVIPGQTGTAASTAATSASFQQVVSGLSGLTAASVGRFLTLAGASNTRNIGTFLIVAQTGTTATIINPDGTADASNGALNWTELRGGTGASITAVVDGPDGSVATLTGLTNLVAPNAQGGNTEGNFIAIAGAATAGNNGWWQVVDVLSATSCKVLAPGAVAGDANNGALEWTEVNPVPVGLYPSAVYPYAAWILLEGPHTVQLMAASIPGAFARGETVTQTGTGATGEVVGVVWDDAAVDGWAIIRPHTGLFNGTGVITGSTSGATLTPNAIRRYRREMVIQKQANEWNAGSIWYGVYREDTEANLRLSTLALNAACTAAVAPGGSTTAGNVFADTGQQYAVVGQNTTSLGQAVSHAPGFFATAMAVGRVQLAATNVLTGKAGRSADGSFFAFAGNTAVTARGNLLAYQIVDDLSPGEAEHYFWHRVMNTNGGSAGKLYAAGDSGAGALGVTGVVTSFFTQLNFYCWRKVWQRADSKLASTVAFTYLMPHVLAGGAVGYDNGVFAALYGRPITLREANHPRAVSPIRRMPLFFGYSDPCRARWLSVTFTGNGYDTADNKTLVQLAPRDDTNRVPGLLIGPWNGQDSPVQS